MGKLSEIFTSAYEKVAKKGVSFSDDHRLQLDALQVFVDELNAESNFSAVLKGMASTVPALEIKDKATGSGQIFFIAYGFDPFGGKPTLEFSTTLARTPFGSKKEGYSLLRDNDRNDLLKEMGAEVARKVLRESLGKETVAYIGAKPGNTP